MSIVNALCVLLVIALSQLMFGQNKLILSTTKLSATDIALNTSIDSLSLTDSCFLKAQPPKISLSPAALLEHQLSAIMPNRLNDVEQLMAFYLAHKNTPLVIIPQQVFNFPLTVKFN